MTPPLPYKSPEFAEAFEDWKEFRKEIKKPLTPTAFKRQVKFLESLGEQGAMDSINQSIVAGWQGLFPPAKSITHCKTVNFHQEGGGF